MVGTFLHRGVLGGGQIVAITISMVSIMLATTVAESPEEKEISETLKANNDNLTMEAFEMNFGKLGLDTDLGNIFNDNGKPSPGKRNPHTNAVRVQSTRNVSNYSPTSSINNRSNIPPTITPKYRKANRETYFPPKSSFDGEFPRLNNTKEARLGSRDSESIKKEEEHSKIYTPSSRSSRQNTGMSSVNATSKGREIMEKPLTSVDFSGIASIKKLKEPQGEGKEEQPHSIPTFRPKQKYAREQAKSKKENSSLNMAKKKGRKTKRKGKLQNIQESEEENMLLQLLG